ncbi:hypothetical protein [Streptosporangium roseum]|uniref:hypothetical protein n=1 Tax=Streptosporangium roseum TaxID=2001 RepID=UPI003332F1FF
MVLRATLLLPWLVPNAATGYTGYTVSGVDAEHMIEDGFLCRYVGPEWNWRIVSGVSPLVSNTGGLYRWSVLTSAFTGAGTTHAVVFNGAGDSPDAYTGVITVTQS